MENSIYFISIIAFGIHLLLCHECGKVARKKGLKYSDAFLVSFFGSVVAGFLYVIAHLLPAQEAEVAESGIDV